ncbi:MAG: rod shape-determining protein MreC [Halothermotrichaceae bacterium]
MNKFSKSTLIISVALILVVAGFGVISFSNINLPFLNWIESGVYNIISPVLEGYNNFCNSVKNHWNAIVNNNQLIEENQRLKQRISQLETKLIQSEYQVLQNQRLRQLLNFEGFTSFESVGCRVIGYSTSYWNHKIVIDKGTKDGIDINMPVITYGGALVGKIDYAGAYSSQVLLINDPGFTVGGIVQRQNSRAIGLIKGQGDNRDLNIMEDISWNKKRQEGDIKEDDIIVTSGLSNRYPRGLPIGKVVEVKQDDYGLSQRAQVEIFMNSKTIEEVLVIKEF